MPAPTAKGVPSVYAIFNLENARRIQFDIIPDTSTVANNTITVEFYTRLPFVTSVQGEQCPDIPDYFESVLLYGAYKRMCAHVGDAQGITIYQGLEREALERVQRIDIMQPDADRRFRLIDEVPTGFTGSGFIYPF